ncbi:NAD(P)H-dependent D-xylose reductase (XR), partial [Ascosphaera atra]
GFQEITGMAGVEGVELLFKNKTINAIAKKHNMTPPQVLLRWSTQRGVAVIPKGDCPEHLAQNMANLNFKLDNEDIETIFKLNRNLRFNDPPNYGFDCPIFA